MEDSARPTTWDDVQAKINENRLGGIFFGFPGPSEPEGAMKIVEEEASGKKRRIAETIAWRNERARDWQQG